MKMDEIGSYLTNAIPARGIRRLCILTTFRTGSQLLVELLDAHPNIRCEGEVMTAKPLLPFSFIRGRVRRASSRGFRAYGFKLLALHVMDHFNPPDRAFIRRLASDGFVFVHLQRRDILRQAISYFRASVTGRWHERSDGPRGPRRPGWQDGFTPITWRFASYLDAAPPTDVGPLTVDVPTLFFALRLIEIQNEGLGWLVNGLPHLDLWYEDDLELPEGHQVTVDRICDLLQITSHPVTAGMTKIAEPRLETDVANLEKIRRHFTGTRYESLLA